MRLVYLGTPADAVPSLRALVLAGHEIPFVVTQPDRRRGRGGALVASPVKEAALELGLDVETPERATEIADKLAASGAEVGVVVAFGQLLPQSLLDIPPLGFVNVHFSLLPRWRGAAPVERAMLAGDRETGVCIMALEKGLDTGPVFARAVVPIGDSTTAGELRRELVAVGTDLLVETLPKLRELTPEPQGEGHTYASRLEVDEFVLDWSRPASELALLVRAGNPRPGAFTAVNGKRLKVWGAHAADGSGSSGSPGALLAGAQVATGDGVLVLEEVQPEGKARMPGPAWAAGVRGDVVLGS